MNLYDYISFIDKLFTINWATSNFTMRDYDNIYMSLINIKEILSNERVGPMHKEETARRMTYSMKQLFVDDIFRKIDIDKLTVEQLITLYGRIFTEIEKRMMPEYKLKE